MAVAVVVMVVVVVALLLRCCCFGVALVFLHEMRSEDWEMIRLGDRLVIQLDGLQRA